jgi:hypothetical protein
VSPRAEQARQEAGPLPVLVAVRVIRLETSLVDMVVPVGRAVRVPVLVRVLDVIVVVVAVRVLVRRAVGVGVRVSM